MANIKSNITELIGNTPLVRLQKLEKEINACAEIVVKIEYFNPGGSAKDRVAMNIIKDAEEAGNLSRGDTIIEATSGNTGVGLAMVAAARGYRAIMVMPETMSSERKNLIAAYGAEVVLTPGNQGMKGSVDKACQLAKEIPGSIIAGQFMNQANPEIHFKTTGPEIWEDTDGRVDIFVAGVGTGGTITGVGNFLRSKNEKIKIVAVEPTVSPLLSGGKAGPHPLQGIGANFVPEVLDTDVYNQIITVTGDAAMGALRKLASLEGIFVGISGGAALWAGMKLAQEKENEGKRIVVLLPDTGERYLSLF